MKNNVEKIRVPLTEWQEEIQSEVCAAADLKLAGEECRQAHLALIGRLCTWYCQSALAEILLSAFPPAAIKKDGFLFQAGYVPCSGLEKWIWELSAAGRNGFLENAYLYAFCAPQAELGGCSLLEQYYLEAVQIAALNKGRIWLRDELRRRNKKETIDYVSDSFAPGFFGMPLESAEVLLKELNAAEAGLEYRQGVVYPLKSCCGIYLAASIPIAGKLRDCASCQGNRRGCRLCLLESDCPTQSDIVLRG